jgi:hypothetical protein|tara:strand:+ start:25 stop:240 length:216 start_codon:yes stop_codon:yes gene_type:complete
MAKDIKLEQLLGITKEPLETMSHAEMLSNNLKLQHEKVSKEILSLESQLADKKEYLAKIEGGLDVIEELQK